MQMIQLLSIVTLFHGGYSLNAGRRQLDTPAPQDFPTEFYNLAKTNISIQTVDGTQYSIELDPRTLCDDVVIGNFPPGDTETGGASTLISMLRYLDQPDVDIKAFSQQAAESALAVGIPIYNGCVDYPYDPEGADPALVSSAITGVITVSLLKGAGTNIVAGLLASRSDSRYSGIQMGEAAVSAGISTGLVYILNAVVKWIPKQETLRKEEAAMLKILAEWSRSALERAASAHIENTNVCVNHGLVADKHLAFLARFSKQENPLYQDFGLLSGSELQRELMRGPGNGDHSVCSA